VQIAETSYLSNEKGAETCPENAPEKPYSNSQKAFSFPF